MSAEQPTDSANPTTAPAVDPAPPASEQNKPAEPEAAPPTTAAATEPPAKEDKKLPATQRSWRLTGSGEPAKVLKLAEDTPVPAKLKKGEVLVKVHAAALNPVGYKMMALLPGFVNRRVQAAEYDLAGVVVDGNGTELKEGDEVFGWIPAGLSISTGQGALAQYTRLPAANLARRPSNVSATQASGFGIAGLTAYQALVDVARLKEGQWVFVNGGSTAVGSFAIMIAKALGAHVGASASGKNEEYVRGLGADEFFDYTESPLHEQLAAANKDKEPKYDVFLEAVGVLEPTLFVKSAAYLAPRGVFISVGPQGSGLANFVSFAWNVFLRPSFLGGTKRKWKLVTVKPVHEDLEAFAKLVEEGKVRPLVDSVYAFEDVLKAYEKLMTKRATGKIVVKVDPTAE
ncbi:NAD-P-binding protein [Cubamyces menziesii]|nr:NAD-P-binding protein [Cubamyces menziesii]